MTLAQQIITVGMCVLATLLTRFLPFAVFNAAKPTPQYIHYLGELLPGAIFAMLVIYCLRNVSLLSGSHGPAGADRHCRYRGAAPVEAADAAFHRGGTICYMLLVQLVF